MIYENVFFLFLMLNIINNQEHAIRLPPYLTICVKESINGFSFDDFSLQPFPIIPYLCFEDWMHHAFMINIPIASNVEKYWWIPWTMG